MGSVNTSEEWQERPLWAQVDLDALAHNIRALKRQAGQAKLAAVVKANAYGHGAVETAKAALAAGADRLAVVCVDEGEQLRYAGIEAPILVLGYSPIDSASQIVEHKLTPTIGSIKIALALAEEAQAHGLVQPIHLKIDTGLSRYGMTPEDGIALAESLRKIPSLTVEGLFTHFASADEVDKTYTIQQYKTFQKVTECLPWVPMHHVSNTATLLDMPEMSLDLVRPGIGIYGCYPSPEVSRSVSLKPVMTLRSRIIRITHLASGEGVSYGHTWKAARPSVIALVMGGYGDGLPRALSNRGAVLIRGERAPIVGRVCMDMSIVDVTDIPAVDGDEAIMIGSQNNSEIPVEEIAEICQTINYDILSGITARVPRIYTESGNIVATDSLIQGREMAPGSFS